MASKFEVYGRCEKPLDLWRAVTRSPKGVAIRPLKKQVSESLEGLYQTYLEC